MICTTIFFPHECLKQKYKYRLLQGIYLPFPPTTFISNSLTIENADLPSNNTNIKVHWEKYFSEYLENSFLKNLFIYMGVVRSFWYWSISFNLLSSIETYGTYINYCPKNIDHIKVNLMKPFHKVA